VILNVNVGVAMLGSIPRALPGHQEMLASCLLVAEPIEAEREGGHQALLYQEREEKTVARKRPLINPKRGNESQPAV
jgi:hypothetical protein